MPQKPVCNLSHDDRNKTDNNGHLIRQNDASESEDSVVSIVDWVKQREVEIMNRNSILNKNKIVHKIITTNTTSK